MWNQYFSENCNVMGIDIEQTELCDSNLDVTYGDSKDANLWTEWDNFDIIIDDGDHSPDAQLETARVWIPKVKKSGLYIIEDVFSFRSDWFGHLLQEIGKLDLTVNVLDMRGYNGLDDNVMIVFSDEGLGYVKNNL